MKTENIFTYRDVTIQKHRNGYLASVWGKEIYCDSLDEAYALIDEYLED